MRPDAAASDNPAKMLQFKSASQSNFLPVVEGYHYGSLCEALLSPNKGTPAYAQIDEAVATRCPNGASASQRVQMFGGFGAGCESQLATRRDDFLQSGAGDNPTRFSWVDHFGPNADPEGADKPRFLSTFRMYGANHGEAQTNYLLMRLPLASVGDDPASRRNILRDARICQNKTNDELDEKLAFVAHDKYLVFDPQSPARTSFLFDELNTPVQLFFRDDQRREDSKALVRLEKDDASVEPQSWINRVYRYQWGPPSDTLASIIVPKQPHWLKELDAARADGQVLAITTVPERAENRVILQFVSKLTGNAQDSRAGTFEHTRIALPFDNKATTAAELSAGVAAEMTGLVPREGPLLEVRATDEVTFTAILNTSLDAAYLTSATRQDCIDNKRRMVLRANSPFETFGDDAPYALRLDGSRVRTLAYVSRHCHILDHYEADANARVNGPEPAIDWYEQPTFGQMRNVAFNSENTRDVRLSDGRTVTLPDSFTSNLPATGISHPGFTGGVVTRFPAKFVLVENSNGGPYYLQDFSVSTLTGLAYFDANQSDFRSIVGDLLDGETYQNKCYTFLLDLELLMPLPKEGDAVNPKPSSAQERLWLMLMHGIAAKEFENDNGMRFLREPNDETCDRTKAFFFHDMAEPRLMQHPVMQNLIKKLFPGTPNPSDALEDAYNAVLAGTADDATDMQQKLAGLRAALPAIKELARRIHEGSEFPLPLVTNDQATRLVQGVMGFPSEADRAFSPDVTFQNLNWRLQPMSEEAYQGLVNDTWKLYKVDGADTGETTAFDGTRKIVPFGDGSLTYFLPDHALNELPPLERVKLGIHNLVDGPFIELQDSDGSASFTGKQTERNSATNKKEFSAFSARLMLTLNLDDEE
ncbi:hypothetical protein [Ruegeria sp. HKCCD7318]|uniref:hypothetical protein n=1 Tax=Ruegeria sp. HKCCD7318 TaxID=2683014 RepID=UPI001492BB49|nr:hypothetical protein [Ruegeria sp. HKCCD7318]NOE36230.1 hypothetical protein [Ruegeria sp. HKCCD7318]